MTDNIFWNRYVRVEIGENASPDNAISVGGEGSEFRIDFAITKSRDSTANKAIIDIYNLSPEHRRKADKEWNRVIVYAGYKGYNNGSSQKEDSGFWGIIFDGWTKKITHSRQSDVDVISRFECIDGGVDHANSRINGTWSPDTRYSDIVKEIVSNMKNITLGDISGIKDSYVVASDRSRVFSTTGKNALDAICKTYDCRWTIDNNILDIVANSSVLRGGYDVPLLSSTTGMIGSPVITEKGINVETLINPHIRINRLIYVEDDFIGTGRKGRKTLSQVQQAAKKKAAEALDTVSKLSSIKKSPTSQLGNSQDGGGLYRVNQMTYNGSTHSNEFYINIEGHTSDGYKVVRPAVDKKPIGSSILAKVK